MASIFVTGRVCYKMTGRDAGKRVIVIEDAKNGFAIVEGSFTKKGKVNVAHLLPTTQTIALPADYSRKDLTKILEKGE